MAKPLSEALDIVVKTDPGIVRGHNEDAVFANPDLGLVILADGMGGYNAGEVASGMATMFLSTELERVFSARPPGASLGGSGDDPAQLSILDRIAGDSFVHRSILQQVAMTNSAIFNTAESQAQYAGMGTTLVAALFHDNLVTVAHIGDSRLYRLRGDEFCALTRDHSLLQEQIDSGMITAEEARFSKNKNLVTRALGVDAVVETEIHDYPVLQGDLYLLCSDGLNDMVEDEEIHLTLQMLSANLELAATQLIEMANDNGGRDNVSVILIKVLHDFSVPRDTWSKFKAWFRVRR
ncbi:MAG: PP2C family serine/threonine-protein phosphatase [Betaproteobacteria bacterium]